MPASTSPHSPSAGIAGLTSAEREVVTLVSEGLTNAEIGARLHLSRRTVQGHLYRVFKKLGVRTRTELAAVWLSSVRAEASVQAQNGRIGTSQMAQGTGPGDGE